MKKICLLIASVVFCFSGLSSISAAESDTKSGVEFNIRFYDRRIYYVNNDPIKVQITITNKSPDTYRFKLADERAFSVDFDIRTMTNRPVAKADMLIRKRTTNQQIFFREIAIGSGESFSFEEDLRDYVNLSQSGSFRVQAVVYPELYREASLFHESNYLALNLRPPLITGADGIPIEMDVATGAVLVPQQIPPDEVVTYMLKARQTSQWEKFFLYLDLEAMISRDPLKRRKWLFENEDGRRKMLMEYRQDLQNSVVDGDISVIPTSFDILRTTYSNNTGTVIVLAKFRSINYTDLRRYTYYLERRDNIWVIVNYTVEGMGTEAND